jgi:hypothetical protein
MRLDYSVLAQIEMESFLWSRYIFSCEIRATLEAPYFT